MSRAISLRERQRAQTILSILRNRLQVKDENFATLVIANETDDLFKVLVMTILTQNCTDVAALRAYRCLDEKIGVDVKRLSSAELAQIRRAIRVAGLYKQKAVGIRQLARILKEQDSGDFSRMTAGDLEEVRSRFQKLPQIGPKTTDVVLSVFGRETISVDTHVDRVSKRLGFADRKANYERTRASLMQRFRREDYRSIPLLFMTLGREICRARRPLCSVCPVEKLCPYPRKTK